MAPDYVMSKWGIFGFHESVRYSKTIPLFTNRLPYEEEYKLHNNLPLYYQYRNVQRV